MGFERCIRALNNLRNQMMTQKNLVVNEKIQMPKNGALKNEENLGRKVQIQCVEAYLHFLLCLQRTRLLEPNLKATLWPDLFLELKN